MVVLLLQLHNSIRARHYLHRPAIVMPSESPWQRLYEQADPSSFLHMTGLTRRCFATLLAALFDPDEMLLHQHHWRGRPRSLRPEGCLGLLLFYLGSTMNHKHLCMIFGIVPGVCSLAGNVGDMSATCWRQGKMSPIFVPTGKIWQHVFLCVGTLLCRDFPTLTDHEQTIFCRACY
jgi:hypothetical protein